MKLHLVTSFQNIFQRTNTQIYIILLTVNKKLKIIFKFYSTLGNNIGVVEKTRVLYLLKYKK